MSLDYLTMSIKYNMKDSEFDISSNMKKDGQKNLLEKFLMAQIGAGKDESKANEQEVYTITLKWFPENDTIEAQSDTGNKGLRDGILGYILSQWDN